jgi:methanogenic corrinoid protein MtbC1
MADMQANATIRPIVTAFADEDFDRVPPLVGEGIAQGLDVHLLLGDGLVAVMRDVGEMLHRDEVFLPETMLGAEAWQTGVNMLEPL